jgi:hypothetical protein
VHDLAWWKKQHVAGLLVDEQAPLDGETGGQTYEPRQEIETIHTGECDELRWRE